MNMLITLVGQKIRLAPLLPSHANVLLNAAEDGQLWNLPFTLIPSKETINQYITNAIQGRAAGTVIPFVVEDLATNCVIGSTRYWKIDPHNRKLEIGHTWYSESFQRTYVNTEAKYLLLQYAFEKLNCVRIQFTTDEINEKSRKAILRIGAKEEGIVRNERIMPNGRIRNSVRYSIIDSEWPAVKKLLESKLII
jgi:RimJ/RimL family protein N-acetyltransferase